MKNPTLIAMLVAAGTLGAALPTHAENGSDEGSETVALQSTKLTAEDAIKAAVAKVPGMVSSVQIYGDAGKPAYHVEIIGSDGRQQDLSVDAVSGAVMKMAANPDDVDDHHESGEDQD